MAGGGTSAVAVGAVVVGGTLIWSGLKGASLLRTAQELIQGKQPTGQNDNPIPVADAGAAGDTAAGTAAGPGGTVTIDGHPVAAWLAALVTYAKAHGWHGTVTSGYRSYQDQVRVYNSGVRPAAKPGASHHQGLAYPDGAIDVSGGAESFVAIVRGSGLLGATQIEAAGAKDPPHISIPGSHRSGEGTY